MGTKYGYNSGTIGGVNLGSLKKFLKYVFGDFVYSCKRNTKQPEYDVIFRDKLFIDNDSISLDIEEVRKFKEFFKNEGVSLKVIVFKAEDIDQQEEA